MFTRECLGLTPVVEKREADIDRRKSKEGLAASADPTGSSGAEITLHHCPKPGWNDWALKLCLNQSLDVSCPPKGHEFWWGSSLQLSKLIAEGCLLTVLQVAGTRLPSAKGNLSVSPPCSFPLPLSHPLHICWGVASPIASGLRAAI